MPRRDGSGPMGSGMMTGRGLGFCGGQRGDRYTYGQGIGSGLGFACRRGFSDGFVRGVAINQNIEKSDKDLLEEQKELLQSRLDAIDKQLEEL